MCWHETTAFVISAIIVHDMKRVAYLGLGANIGDRESNLRTAIKMLIDCGCELFAVSSLYQTRPVGLIDQPDFLNAVVGVMTNLDPHALLATCKKIESKLGRKRTTHWGPRVIDIDILLYEGVVMDDAELVIPHPHMLDRAFVLVPLAEIAPDIEIALGIKACNALLSVDSSEVELFRSSPWSD